MYTQSEIYYKELSHVIMESDKFKIYSVSWQAGDPRESKESKGSLLKNSLLLEEASLFVLCGPLVDWMSPAHIKEDNLLSSKFI